MNDTGILFVLFALAYYIWTIVFIIPTIVVVRRTSAIAGISAVVIGINYLWCVGLNKSLLAFKNLPNPWLLPSELVVAWGCILAGCILIGILARRWLGGPLSSVTDNRRVS